MSMSAMRFQLGFVPVQLQEHDWDQALMLGVEVWGAVTISSSPQRKSWGQGSVQEP